MGTQPQRIAHVWSDESAAQFLRSLFNERAAILIQGVQAWMWIPLAVNGGLSAVWVIALLNQMPSRIHQANLAMLMANQAAITMVNAQLKNRRRHWLYWRNASVWRKICTTLSPVALFRQSDCRGAAALWERNPQEALQSLEDLRRLTRGAMAEMRGLLAELPPSGSDRF